MTASDSSRRPSLNLGAADLHHLRVLLVVRLQPRGELLRRGVERVERLQQQLRGNDKTTFETLSRYFDATEIVELTTVAAFRGLMNRFMDSLQIELEGPELQARGGKAVASPEYLHAYLQKIIDV